MCHYSHRKTIFNNDLMEKIIPDVLAPYATLIIVLVLALICKVLLDLYLNTKSGFLLRALGIMMYWLCLSQKTRAISRSSDLQFQMVW